jgi:pyruvate ferredoxin oxidoreductase gamma subunit
MPNAGLAGLPGAGADGCFGIRFESIGGLGAHLAGRMLAEAGVLRHGLNGAHFSSYGSEKKGSPVKSYVRLSPPGRAIRTSSPVESPQVVAVFHEALARSLDVTAGLDPAGTLIVNTTSPPGAVRERLGDGTGTVAVVDALGIAIEEATRVNTAMLGAVVAHCPFIDPEAVRAEIRDTLSRRYRQLVDANLRTFDRGFRELREETIVPKEGAQPSPLQRPAPAFGYLDAPLGGTIPSSGNSVVRDLSSSRQGMIPVFDAGSCVHCGLCDLVCPDYCLVWEERPNGEVRLRGIDYRYCKGCMKCTEACPTASLVEAREENGYADEHRVALFAEREAPAW